MKKQRVILRADANKKTGFGHFIRSIALAGYLKDNFDCCFASYNSDLKSLSRFQLSEIIRTCSPFVIQGKTLEEFNEDFLEQLYPTDIVVLDNYYFSTEYQQKIKDKGCRLVCIDDMHDRHMVCDLLITPSPLSREDFSLEDYTVYRGGVEWAFLREPFLSPLPVRNVSKQMHNIVMAMGGADAFNLTDKFIRIIHDVLPHFQIHAICGDSVIINEESKRIAYIHKNVSAQEIVNLFDNADIGIFPASTITIEAISRKLPVIAGYYVDNQKAFYEVGKQREYFAPLGCLLDESESIAQRLIRVLYENRPMPILMNFRVQKQRIIDLFNQLKER